MPGIIWTGEEKANVKLEIMTTSTSAAEIYRRNNIRPILVYSWRTSFLQAGTGTGASDIEKQLEKDNKRLKAMAANHVPADGHY